MGNQRPWTDSILGRLTSWDTKVGNVICDTCGKVILPDVKLKDLHDLDWYVECIRRKHRKDTIEMLSGLTIEEGEKIEKTNPRIFVHLILDKMADQCTLKWTPIIEQKLKEMGVF